MFRFWNTEAKGLNVYKASWRIDPTWLLTAIGCPPPSGAVISGYPHTCQHWVLSYFFFIVEKNESNINSTENTFIKEAEHFKSCYSPFCHLFNDSSTHFFWSIFLGGIKFYLYWLINEICLSSMFPVFIEHYEYLFQCFLVFKLWFWSFWGTEFYIFKELKFFYFSLMFVCVCLVVQLYPTLCNPIDYSLPGSSVHGIFQQKYWSGLPFPPPGDCLDPEMETTSLLGSCIGRCANLGIP